MTPEELLLEIDARVEAAIAKAFAQHEARHHPDPGSVSDYVQLSPAEVVAKNPNPRQDMFACPRCKGTEIFPAQENANIEVCFTCGFEREAR
jgi:hypothetical protein